MGLRIKNKREVVLALQYVDKEVNHETRKAFMEAAELVKKTTVEYAPIDEGNLEESVRIVRFGGNNQYRMRLTIAVGGMMNGRNVSEYAAYVHEYTWDMRGPLTKAKGPKAGPRYLFRAMRDQEKEVQKILEAAMKKGIAKGISKSGVNAPKRRRK